MNQQQIDTLARELSGKLLRTAILPIMTIQLLLVPVITLGVQSTIARASDDTPAVAALPDDRPAPAPEGNNTARNSTASKDNTAVRADQTTTPAVADSPVADAPVADAAVAEVISTQEVASPIDPIEPAGDSVKELSVPPSNLRILPADRPAWVSANPDVSNSFTHRISVGSLPTATAEEADDALDSQLVEKLNDYLDQHVLSTGQAVRLRIDSHFIRENLLDDSKEYIAELRTQEGPMYQKWVVLNVTPEQREYFVQQYRQLMQRDRVIGLGIGLLAVLSITGIANLAFARRQRRYANVPLAATIFSGPHGHDGGPAAMAMEVAPHANQPVSLPVLQATGKKRKKCCSWRPGLVVLAIITAVLFTKAIRSSHHHRLVAEPAVVSVHHESVDGLPWQHAKRLAAEATREAREAAAEIKEDVRKTIANVEASIEKKNSRTRITVGGNKKLLEITHELDSDDKLESHEPE